MRASQRGKVEGERVLRELEAPRDMSPAAMPSSPHRTCRRKIFSRLSCARALSAREYFHVSRYMEIWHVGQLVL
jgi:hypothetical protein